MRLLSVFPTKVQLDIEPGRERCNGEAGNEFAESIKKTWRENTWT